MNLKLRPIAVAVCSAFVFAACGGGGGGGDGGTPAGGGTPSPGTPSPGPGPSPSPTPTPQPPAAIPGATLTMSCPEGAGWLCSGHTILRTEPYNIAILQSGVQAYGKASRDFETGGPVNPPSGLAPAVGGTTEMRILKADGITSDVGVRLILSNLGLSYTGAGERPTIIEVFRGGTAPGRSVMAAPGAVVTDVGLPPAFTLGDQLLFSNNRYFPKPLAALPVPLACAPLAVTECNRETVGLQDNVPGSFRAGVSLNSSSDRVTASRFHEDGDLDVPTQYKVPGSKGFRGIRNYGYLHANIANWGSSDTVNIEVWRGAAALNEHVKNRRGSVAYGEVTTPATVPTTGTAAYSETQAVNPVSGEQSIVAAYYTPDGSQEPIQIVGKATVTADFATRLVTVVIRNIVTLEPPQVPVATLPSTFTIIMAMGNSGANTANYMTGAGAFNVGAETLNGGMSARFFGPVSGGGPAEVGGTFSLASTTGAKAAIIGGFIAKK